MLRDGGRRASAGSTRRSCATSTAPPPARSSPRSSRRPGRDPAPCSCRHERQELLRRDARRSRARPLGLLHELDQPPVHGRGEPALVREAHDLAVQVVDLGLRARARDRRASTSAPSGRPSPSPPRRAGRARPGARGRRARARDHAPDARDAEAARAHAPRAPSRTHIAITRR